MHEDKGTQVSDPQRGFEEPQDLETYITKTLYEKRVYIRSKLCYKGAKTINKQGRTVSVQSRGSLQGIATFSKAEHGSGPESLQSLIL